ncbi:MAG: NAD(P)H-binding protein [Chloroflexales bacterium]|nr:NAD(P)H-binding protein [Chloroflexales bacterium]
MEAYRVAGHDAPLTLVLGGTGKTGRRVVERLQARSVATRVGSRAGVPRFDWDDRETWAPALRGVGAVYVAYAPDLAVPAAEPAITGLVEAAAAEGVERLVLLSGRGEAEAERCERIVQGSGMAWTILRASWFAQNFTEGFFYDLVLSGEVALPAGPVAEPFVDAEDIAAVAVAALTEEGHGGQLYELTGPRLLSFAEAVATIAGATGRPVRYVPISVEAFVAELAAQQVPDDAIALLRYLFTTVLDGRNEALADGVRQALGREPHDFAAFARGAAARGAWSL